MGCRDRSDLAARLGTTVELLTWQQVNSPHPMWPLRAAPCPVAQAAKLGGELNWGAERGPGKWPGQACCKARAAVRDRNRNRDS